MALATAVTSPGGTDDKIKTSPHTFSEFHLHQRRVGGPQFSRLLVGRLGTGHLHA
jgi:hypothetical protein